MQWNYFGSGHGKGEHNGAGAVIKRALTSEQLDNKGAELQNAHDVVECLKWKMLDDGKNRLFIEVGANRLFMDDKKNLKSKLSLSLSQSLAYCIYYSTITKLSLFFH